MVQLDKRLFLGGTMKRLHLGNIRPKTFLTYFLIVTSIWSFGNAAQAVCVSNAPELIALINVANTNNHDDVLSLCDATIHLTDFVDTTDGNNGLPPILPDGGHSLTITDGTIERDLSAPHHFRIFHVNSGATLILDGVTIANGISDTGPGNGGGIYNAGNLSVTNSVFYNNQATLSGGGIYNSGPTSVNMATLSVEGCLFSNNGADFGGGIESQDFSAITLIDNTTFMNNTAVTFGGGLEIFTTDINPLTVTTISNSTFSGNVAGQSGGGFYNNGAKTDLIINSTFANNTAGVSGGGISNVGLITDLWNCTISGNTTPVTTNPSCSGGINNAGTITSLISTIVAANQYADLDHDSDLDCAGPDYLGNIPGTEHNNLIGTNQGNTFTPGTPNSHGDYVGNGSQYIDPDLGVLSDNGGPTETMPLFSNSPAIAAGANPNSEEWDQRGPGFPRMTNGKTDIGAYERPSAGTPGPEGPRGPEGTNGSNGANGVNGIAGPVFPIPVPPLEMPPAGMPPAPASIDGACASGGHSIEKAPRPNTTPSDPSTGDASPGATRESKNENASGCSLVNTTAPGNMNLFALLLFSLLALRIVSRFAKKHS